MTSALLGAVLLTQPPATATAQELRFRLRETFQREYDGLARDSLMQNYELNFRNDITRTLYWQTRLRAFVSSFDSDGTFPSFDTRLVEPFLQVVYRGSDSEASAGARLTDVAPFGNHSLALRSERLDLFGTASLTRENWPRIDWSVYRIDLREDSVDTTVEDRSIFTGSWRRDPGGLNFSLENRWFTDRETDFTRDSIRTSGGGDLGMTFAEGRVSLAAQALLVSGRVEEETPQALDVDVFRNPRQGLYAQDTTPLTGLLANQTGLIDGDVAAPVADLSGDFRNFGVDLGSNRDMDTAFLFIERQLIPGNERDYAWDVYVSTDGLFWTPHVVAAATRFDGLLNRFEIRFPSVSARYLKVVNTTFSLNEPPLAATELQVSGLESRTGSATTLEDLRSGNLTITWRATRALDFTLAAFGSRQSVDFEGNDSFDQDLNAALSTSIHPGATLTTTVRLQAVNRRSSVGIPEDDRIASVTLAATPLPTLDWSVTGTHRRNTSSGIPLITSQALDFRTGARLLRDLDGAIDLGFLHQEEDALGRTTIRRHVLIALNATLRPGLFWTNSWGAERVIFEGTAAGDSRRTDLDLRSRISYRPTRVLGAALEYMYQDIAGLSGATYLYDLDWLPLPGGALQLQASFRRDQSNVTASLREERRAGARWNLNPNAVLDAAYSVITTGTTAASARHRTLSVFLEYRL